MHIFDYSNLEHKKRNEQLLRLIIFVQKRSDLDER